MKKTKKALRTVTVALIILVILAAVYFFASGMRVVTSAFIDGFSVSPDGDTMTLHVGVSSSVGFVRSVKVQKKDDTLVLKFYSAFGGVNGSVGAKNTFDIPLYDDTGKIAVYKGKNDCATVILKDEDGTWKRSA